MILWNINKLKQLLAEEGLPQKTCLYYLLLFGLAITGGMEFMAYSPYEEPNIWRYIITVGYLVSSAAGTLLFYRANGGKSGRDLIDRYISIGFVVTVRLFPLILIIMVGLGIYWAVVFGEREVYPVTPVQALLTIGWTILIWANMVKHVGDIANA